MIETSSIDEFLAGSLRSIRASQMAAWAMPSSVSWEQVWERIEYHGIPFLLHRRAEQLRDWPSLLIERIAEEARLVILWETTHHDCVAKLIQALDLAGIGSVIMKGTALAYSLHDEPATRRRGDTDLLVHPDNQEQTRAIFKALGWYRREDPHGLYYQEGWLHDAAGFFVHSVDLHWEPSDRPMLQAMLPREQFLAQKQPIPGFDPAAFRPDLIFMVLHAAINQKWHALHGYDAEAGRLSSPRRLIWSVDFDLLTQAMSPDDWRRLVIHCEQHGVGALVAAALRGMQQDLHIDLPEEGMARLESRPLNASVAAYFDNADSLNQFWIDLRQARSLEAKRRLILMRAFPPRDHLIEKYPSASNWPTVMLQGRLILETAGRAMRKAVSQ